MPSKSSGLRVSGTFSLNSPSSRREAVTLSDTQELAGARTPAPGWDMTQVSRCWPWQPLAFPRKVLQSPQAFHKPPALATEGGWPLPAGKQMGTRGTPPQPCVLRGSQEDRTAHGKAWPQRTVSTPLGSLQSHCPKGERRKQPVAVGHSQSLWTRSQWTEEAPVSKHLPKRAGGTLCGGGMSSCCVHVPRRPRENGLRCSEAQKVQTQNSPLVGGGAAWQTRARPQ